MRIGSWMVVLVILLIAAMIGAGSYVGFKAGERSAASKPDYTKAIVHHELDRVARGRTGDALGQYAAVVADRVRKWIDEVDREISRPHR